MNLKLLYEYRASCENSNKAQKACMLLNQAHWFAIHSEFDPKTGEALPQSLSRFLRKLTQPDNTSVLHDRLWHITEHARPSLQRLIRKLNESPGREQAMLPVHKVRKLDASSFIKLSKRPGRNIREKLAGKPHLQAVRRYQSVDLPENRLLKAFLVRLAELLELRRDRLGEEEDDLLPRIHSWFRSDEAQSIARWNNLPPNNTLLSHRDYRRVWDAWRWLQSLEDDLAHDFDQLEMREETLRKWDEYGQIYARGTHLFADMPVLFDHETFAIRPWVRKRAIKEAAKKIQRSEKSEEVSQPACIDLTTLRPRYATSLGSSMVFRKACLWQQWSNEHESVDIELFHSDAAYLHEDATTIASTDLFFVQEDFPDPLLDRAARAFANKLRATFKNDCLIWLVPDALNDFDLEIIRRNLNATFSGAEPLPRSVASVFEQVDYGRITDGFPVVVVDTLGGTTCATKLIARFDADLKKRVPGTKGYYWERCPPITISTRDVGEKRIFDMVTVDGTGRWLKKASPKALQYIDAKELKADPRIGSFAFCINLSQSSVTGGMRLHVMQTRAGDTPLWRDQIPELYIKGYIDGFYRRFYLVERGTTVKPIRGKAVNIPVVENFRLRAGKHDYPFPIFQGENADELGFSARLDSPEFPLKEDSECKLQLTFEYGADEPYKLVFVPIDKSFPPIRATWRRTEEEVITDAPAPDYPEPLSWDQLRSWNDAQGNEVNLFEWLIYRLITLRKKANKRHGETDEDSEKRTFFNVSRRAFVNRIGVMWADGRSLADNSDQKFERDLKNSLQAVAAMKSKSQRIEVCVWQIFSCLHRDAPRTCIEWLTEQVQSKKIHDPRAVGFALGDVSQEWQQSIFDRLASHPGKDAISVFAYATWREKHFVERFSMHELNSLLKSLSRRMENISPLGIPKNRRNSKWAKRNWARATAEPLELLLGLLRTRASDNSQIRMLLQPHQKITKQLAEQVDRIEDIVAESKISLFSRVQIDVQKPEGIQTPDLIYALRLYLTGDDGSKAIHITGISDTDDD